MKSEYKKMGLDFNILGMLDIQGISQFSEDITILPIFAVYNEFISVIEENDYYKHYEKRGLKKFLLGDALFFYFEENQKDILKGMVYLLSSLYLDCFLKKLDTNISCNDIPLNTGNDNAVFKDLIKQGYLSKDGKVKEKFLKLEIGSLENFLPELKDHEKGKIFKGIHKKINMPYLTLRGALSNGSVYGQKDFPMISKANDSFDILLGSAVASAVSWEKKQKWFGVSTDREFERAVLTSELRSQLGEFKKKNYLIEYDVPTDEGLIKTLAVNFIQESCIKKIKDVAGGKIDFYKTKDKKLYSKMYGIFKFIEYVEENRLFIPEEFGVDKTSG